MDQRCGNQPPKVITQMLLLVGCSAVELAIAVSMAGSYRAEAVVPSDVFTVAPIANRAPRMSRFFAVLCMVLTLPDPQGLSWA
jgi:hypothetical protein